LATSLFEYFVDVPRVTRGAVPVRARSVKKKLRIVNSQSLTPRERELLALFRVMTEPDRRLLLFTAKKLISAKTVSGS
jgi:hypothetical protein